jgi:hypothetical protein
LTKLHPAERITGQDEKKSHQPGVYPMMEINPSERIIGDDEANAHKIKPNPELCKVCQEIADEAQAYMRSHENITEVELAKVVNFFCDKFLKTEMAIQCHEIVEVTGKAFVHVMIKYMDQDIVSCTKLSIIQNNFLLFHFLN